MKFTISFLIVFTLFSCKSKEVNTINNIYNVKDYGAKGDFITDDSKAIQNCFNAIKNNGGGTAYFPNGTYKVSRTTIAGKSWCLLGVDYLNIKGESKEKTSVKLAANQKNFTRILVLEGNSKVTINNITFDGNVSQNNPKKPNEHLGGVFIDHSKDVMISNSNFINTGGDGIGIRGVKTPSKNITIDNCFFDNNQRNGLTLGSGFDGVTIKNNEFGKQIDDSPIDTEPSSGICQNVLIENNSIKTASLLTLGGASDKNPGKNFKVLNNKLYNCSIFMVHADSVIIKNNDLIIHKAIKAGITCLGGNENIYINENNIEIVNKPGIYLVKTQSSKNAPNAIFIAKNQIKVSGEKIKAFDIRGSNNILIENNQIIGNKSNIGIYCFSNYAMNGLKIKNNTIKWFKTGIKIIPLKKNPIKNISIENNQFLSSKNTILKTGIDYKYNGRKELNLLENLTIKDNTFSKNINTPIKE